MGTRSIKHTSVRALMAVGAALLLAACAKSAASTGGGAYGTTSTSTSTSSSISSANVGSVGNVLVGADGRTLYLFTPEKGGTIACTGSCATTWPAVLALSGAKSVGASGGADGSMVGTVKLSDGTLEVTYNGWPLHTYAGDSAGGQANGQGIGGQWFAVTTSGSAAGSGNTSGSGAGGYGTSSGGGYGSGGASSGGSSSNSGW